MMKRKFLAVVLPIIGCATVVGSGFSAWYFGETTGVSKDGQFGVNIAITDEVTDATGSLTIGGDIKEFDTYTLLLDQGGHANLTNLDSGIMLTKGVTLPDQVEVTYPDQVEETTGNDWNFTISYNGKSNTTIKDLYDAGLQIRFEIKINLTANLSYYVGVKSGARVKLTSQTGSLDTQLDAFETSDNGVSYSTEHVLVGDSLTATEAIYNFSLDMNTKGKDEKYSNALFEYKSKPVNDKQYSAMCDALNNQTISFVVSAHLENAGAHLESAETGA